MLSAFGDDVTFLPMAHAEQDMDWKLLGLCAQTDPEMFFPEKGGSTREGKKVCNSCEVKTQCLEWALNNDERFGIWGGMSERERRRIRGDRRRGATLVEVGGLAVTMTADTEDEADDLDIDLDDVLDMAADLDEGLAATA